MDTKQPTKKELLAQMASLGDRLKNLQDAQAADQDKLARKDFTTPSQTIDTEATTKATKESWIARARKGAATMAERVGFIAGGAWEVAREQVGKIRFSKKQSAPISITNVPPPIADPHYIPGANIGRGPTTNTSLEQTRTAFHEALRTIKNKDYIKILSDEQFRDLSDECDRLYQEYHRQKLFKVQELVLRGDPDSAKMLLIEEAEQARKIDLETGSKFEKIKDKVSKGITWFENIGTDPNDSNFTRRLKQAGKLAASISMIGGASAVTVMGLSALGIGSAAAISGGVVSYVGRKALTSVAMSEAMKTVSAFMPPKFRPYMPAILMSGSYLIMPSAGGAMLAAGAVGYGAAKLSKFATKKWFGEEVTNKKTQELKKSDLDLTNLEASVSAFEDEYEKISKEAAKKQMYRRLIAGASALTAGITTLEIMGLAQEHHKPKEQTEEEAEKAEGERMKQIQEYSRQHKPPQPQAEPTPAPKGIVEQPSAAPAPEKPHITQEAEVPKTVESSHSINQEHSAPDQPVVKPETHLGNPDREVVFDKEGYGAQQAIIDLKAKLNAEYHGDFTKAPEGIQEFMKTNSMQSAIKSGFYDPETNHSVVVHQGAHLEIDDNGKLSIHEASHETQTAPTPEEVKARVESEPEEGAYIPRHNPPTREEWKQMQQVEKTPDQPVGQTPKDYYPEYLLAKVKDDLTKAYGAQHQYATEAPVPKTPHQDAPTTQAYPNGEIPVPKKPDSTFTTGSQTMTTGSTEMRIGGGYEGSLTAPEFYRTFEGMTMENYFHLSSEALAQINTAHTSIIHNMGLDQDIDNLRMMMHMQAGAVIKGHTVDSPEDAGFSILLNSLQKLTGVNPNHGFLNMKHDNAAEFIERALQKAAIDGKLEYVKSVLMNIKRGV